VKGLLRDLAALRKQLEKTEPDGARVLSLMHRLGAATVKIAVKGEKSEDKLKALGEGLTDAGEDAPDEEHDAEAAANPKRKTRKA
jgi:hypothetical protein